MAEMSGIDIDYAFEDIIASESESEWELSESESESEWELSESESESENEENNEIQDISNEAWKSYEHEPAQIPFSARPGLKVDVGPDPEPIDLVNLYLGKSVMYIIVAKISTQNPRCNAISYIFKC